ncbi:MAG: hypothetical protein CSB55_05945 [Candidatus Cloacimonadota bacterium]|nr:MAG: hypothetical protein CSB55_05945 [Candidatus Cloacimonadota bacterium]
MPLKYKRIIKVTFIEKLRKFLEPYFSKRRKKKEPVKHRVFRVRKKDKWIYILNFLGIFSWVLLILCTFLYSAAAPEKSNFYDIRFNKNIRTVWDYGILEYLFRVLILGLGISSIGLIINLNRHSRKTDRYRISLIILNVASIFGLFLYVFYF